MAVSAVGKTAQVAKADTTAAEATAKKAAAKETKDTIQPAENAAPEGDKKQSWSEYFSSKLSSFASNVWYVVSCGWLCGSEADATTTPADGTTPANKTEESSDETEESSDEPVALTRAELDGIQSGQTQILKLLFAQASSEARAAAVMAPLKKGAVDASSLNRMLEAFKAMKNDVADQLKVFKKAVAEKNATAEVKKALYGAISKEDRHALRLAFYNECSDKELGEHKVEKGRKQSSASFEKAKSKSGGELIRAKLAQEAAGKSKRLNAAIDSVIASASA